MVEFLLGLFAAPYIYIGLVLVAIICDVTEHRIFSGVITVVMIAGVASVIHNSEVLTFAGIASSWYLMYLVPVYIVLGSVWSIFRWKRHCDKVVSDFEKNPYSITNSRDAIDSKKNVPTITYWGVYWPLSFLSSILHDVIYYVGNAIVKLSKRFYVSISKNANDKLDSLYAQSKESNNKE